jgi:hypothetical protein
MAFNLACTALSPGQAIPEKYTCDGNNRSPALTWSDMPEGTKSYALIMHDPDAHNGDFTHWLLVDIPADRHGLPDGSSGFDFGVSGTNSFGKLGYVGPCPPPGDQPHHYLFDLFAVDVPSLGISPGAKRETIEAAIQGHVISHAQCQGLYAR